MSFLLNLQEIRYFHAKTSEVYDPRNPSTGEAFAFPDLDDLANHVESRIKVKEAELEELEDEISDLKNAIGEESAESMPKSSEKYKEMQAQMSDLHLRLMHADATLLHEVNVAETAAQLQLAVMWYCHWKFDFPPRFLAQLSGDSSVPEDGRAAFKQVNWIDVVSAAAPFAPSFEASKRSGCTGTRLPQAREELLAPPGGPGRGVGAVDRGPHR